VPPGALSLGRLLVAAAALGVMVAWRARRTASRGGARLRLTRGEWSLLALCGVAWFGIYNLALKATDQRNDARTAALIVQVGPIIVALLATVFLGEVLTRWLVIGMAIGFAGVAVIALYIGNPNAHSLSGQLFLRPLIKALRTKNLFSASSVAP
jgi:drug/metabolite transporter (DMT)-like permease